MKKSPSDFHAHFDRIADLRSVYIRRNRAYYRDIQNWLGYVITADASVIELGSGTGNVIGNLKNRKKTGIDFSSRMLEQARLQYPGAEYLNDDIENLQHGSSYDYVLLMDTINVLRDVQKTLSDIRVKLCHDRTRLVITFYNFLWEPLLRFGEWIGIKTPSPEQNWLSKSDIRALLELANFEVVTSGGRILLPRNIPILASVFNGFLAHLPVIRKLCLVQYVIARPRAYGRKEYSVSVVVPARNEAGNIERLLETMPRFGSKQEIIFVEGNSTDDTWQSIEKAVTKFGGKWDIKVLKQTGKGKGDAVRTGFAAAKNDLLMILDADLTVDPAELPKFYEAIASNAGEFINGSRLVYPMEQHAMPLLNSFANVCFSWLFTWLLGQRLKDTLCGTKVLLKSDYERISAGRKFFGDFDPFGDFDLLFGASKLNLKIVDLPVRYRDRTYGQTNIRRFRHGWLLIKMSLFGMRRMKFG
ncbi:glycosyl transferase [Candidatus Peribacteria bacterium RIFCSPLOWO2_01_FULL_51_18]|nr:MAG: glycosyl transferase [Candidatus Peribacteria bacterium RIFCSPHIGHO2_02_FULL_51_15]OGJ65396.1 MAG: glycosyl transferase [Candidatus Peribacteria bacterium RIFCSPLOWO2_01_FULL_51_18]OGJ69136.1 MAG: glycosyl transferase [Candidatus Peribacteria bacterium RIFCSPLOWO2_02_FULL_51_10]